MAVVIVFRLDRRSGVPPYRQLMDQVEQALRLGHLRPGDQLPKVREVVEATAMNPNTVLKAYRELEGKGLAVGRPGVGTFIERGLGPVPSAAYPQLQRELSRWLAQARKAGLDEDSVVALFAAAVRGAFHEGVA